MTTDVLNRTALRIMIDMAIMQGHTLRTGRSTDGHLPSAYELYECTECLCCVGVAATYNHWRAAAAITPCSPGAHANMGDCLKFINELRRRTE